MIVLAECIHQHRVVQNRTRLTFYHRKSKTGEDTAVFSSKILTSHINVHNHWNNNNTIVFLTPTSILFLIHPSYHPLCLLSVYSESLRFIRKQALLLPFTQGHALALFCIVPWFDHVRNRSLCVLPRSHNTFLSGLGDRMASTTISSRDRERYHDFQNLTLESNFTIEDMDVNSPASGKGAFASRDMNVSEIIIRFTEPYLMALDTPRLSDTCYKCHNQPSTCNGRFSRSTEPEATHTNSDGDEFLKKCAGCKVVRYCDLVCTLVSECPATRI